MLYNSHQKEKLGEIKMEKLIFKNLSQLTRELKSGDIVELELQTLLYLMLPISKKMKNYKF